MPGRRGASCSEVLVVTPVVTMTFVHVVTTETLTSLSHRLLPAAAAAFAHILLPPAVFSALFMGLPFLPIITSAEV